jgi:hypothetical protein
LDELTPYSTSYFYPGEPPTNVLDIPPSTSLEKAFTEVHVWHIRHKKAWDVSIGEDEFLLVFAPEELIEQEYDEYSDNEQDI